MKISAIISMLLSITQVQSISEGEIKDVIIQLQGSKLYLDQNALNSNSYQKKAMDAATSTLSNGAKLANFILNSPDKDSSFDYEEKHIRNFYTAASIYFATNGQPNAYTLIQLGDDTEIPGWDDDSGWIENPDYCNWFGIVECFEDNIITIELYNNTLYGTWPQEIGLLGEHLTTIDIDSNTYQYTENYNWFQSMSVLENLYFGATSWEADGIPTELNKLTKLVYFDCNYAFWTGGPIRSEAFENLDDLAYINMASNVYTATPGQEIPSSLQNLPSLVEFYFDSVKFTDEEGSGFIPTLNFLTNMEMVIKAWFDYTKFDGGIPVLPTSLASFSCIFCGLSGGLENLSSSSSIGTNLEEVWLTGNELTGTIPDDIGRINPNLALIHLEGNDLWGTKIPQSICNLAITIGADQNVCEDSCCTCVGSECDYDVDDPVSPPPTEPPVIGGFGCFSGNSMINVENRGLVKMTDLVIGDMVMVGENKFESVYSFGHKNDSAFTEYIRITTGIIGKPLEISAAHMVIIEGGHSVPASTIKKGDKLQTATGDLAAVENIKVVTSKGVYAPFTISGKIVVNDIIASNYIAYQESEYLKIGDIETPFSYQWVAHTFNSIHRLFIMMGFKSETYTESGVSHWVDMPHNVFSWVLKQNVFVSSTLIFSSLFFFGLASVFEVLMLNPLVTMSVILGMNIFIRLQNYSQK